MTENERRQITQLQKEGYGYKKIASELGLAVNGVKSYCRRHPVQKDTPVQFVPGICQQCGVAVKQIPGRKTKRFCSDRCRTTWWNAHPDLVTKKAFYNLVCKQCGKTFTSYGNKNRIYCSRACFGESRRKGVNENG